jgi:hypothetical protein
MQRGAEGKSAEIAMFLFIFCGSLIKLAVGKNV